MPRCAPIIYEDGGLQVEGRAGELRIHAAVNGAHLDQAQAGALHAALVGWMADQPARHERADAPLGQSSGGDQRLMPGGKERPR